MQEVGGRVIGLSSNRAKDKQGQDAITYHDRVNNMNTKKYDLHEQHRRGLVHRLVFSGHQLDDTRLPLHRSSQPESVAPELKMR